MDTNSDNKYYEIDERRIRWIASYPKSGNTWVRMFINAYLSGFPVDINASFQYAIGDNYNRYFQIVSCKPADKLSPIEQFYYTPAVLMTAINLSFCRNLCIKTHHARVVVHDIPLIPTPLSVGGIYIIRDPRDIAISFSHHLGTTIDETIERMNDMQHLLLNSQTNLFHVLTTWSFHEQTWTEKKNYPIDVIKYEDMLVNPKHEFKRVLTSIGVENINEDRFNFALEQTRFSNLRELEDKETFREKAGGEKFFRVGKSGQWKTELTKEQIQRIEENHGEIMQKHGYKLSGSEVNMVNKTIGSRLPLRRVAGSSPVASATGDING